MPSAITVAMVCAEVCRPRTFSSSLMTFAGLKKCVPTTCCGREVLAAIASMSSVEVLVARMAPGAAARSSRANTSRFTARSSKTASIDDVGGRERRVVADAADQCERLLGALAGVRLPRATEAA